ncbi:hypothetical protein BT93_G2125 [Corymbia citriodora subsp. variegata]|nr:hypothetical protein BT93_G2125 [Corymbia citriodora subsp. variegata]
MFQMEEMDLDGLIPYLGMINSSFEIEAYEHDLDQILVKVDELEKRVNEVEQVYDDQSKKQPSTSKGSTIGKDERQINGIKKLQQDACNREAAAVKRMQQLISQFGIILRQVIDKPMDFSTIKKQMEATDGTAYKHVREICADVRLVFKNAMKYNDEKSDIHVMAKTLLRKFEEKWLQLLPKVTEEEKRLEQEEAEAQLDMQLAKEAANARMAREISTELYEVDMPLEELRAIVVSKCRKISTEEKRKIAAALDKLPVEDVDKALEIVAQYDPTFQSKGDLVDLDLDAQSESTLWKLKFFVKSALEVQGRGSTVIDVDSNQDRSNNNNGNNNNNNSNKKRKKEICKALTKTAKKRCLKPSS